MLLLMLLLQQIKPLYTKIVLSLRHANMLIYGLKLYKLVKSIFQLNCSKYVCAVESSTYSIFEFVN